MPDLVRIFDTTLRDGEQSPGFSLNLDEKVKMAEQLEQLGVDIIEAGFPIASEGDFQAVREVSRQARKSAVAGLARATRGDIDRAWEALKHAKHPIIHTFIATSDIHLQFKLRRSREQILEEAAEAVRYARTLCDEVEFSAEDATRSDVDYLVQVVQAAVDAGASTINIPDTVGYTIPDEYAALIRALRERVRGIDKVVLSVHCHNDLGLAVANSFAAVREGARQIECTINGIGERAGNASMEELVMVFRTRPTLNLDTRIRSEEIYRTSRLLCNLTGTFVQPNKAIVGRNAFAHEAGIHQDGVLKNPLTYEIMTPQSIGLKENTLVLGKHSGRHALDSKFKELGYSLNKEDLEKAYLLFCKVADRKKQIYEEDLITIVQDGLQEIPETYHMLLVQSTGGNQAVSSASVRLRKGSEEFTDSAVGDGPVDACYKAIDRITGRTYRLLDYSVRSTTKGKDSIGEVFVRISTGKIEYIGRAASTDIIDASARAYLNAVNKAIYHQQRLALQPEDRPARQRGGSGRPRRQATV
ncbi:MAG: 2-isopropylmalate synthase [Acidobacteria bacterium]|nr:2-isopropylmalate synthase [Acidobacteriota bacterium]